jgi:hypothetical protein
MVLRESGRANEQAFNLLAVVNPTLDSNVADGDLLLAFADAVLGSDSVAMNAARTALAKGLGSKTVGGAAAIAAEFSKNDRIANGVGIPAESLMVDATVELRQQLGINEFRSAVNTLKASGD